MLKEQKLKTKSPSHALQDTFLEFFLAVWLIFWGVGGGVKERSHQSLPKISGKEDKNGVLTATLVIFE